jgi:hypothetical protein
MQSVFGYTNSANFDEIIIVPPKFNRIWGADYMLMDSNSFPDNKGEADYSRVIDMFQNLWDAYTYRVFSGF